MKTTNVKMRIVDYKVLKPERKEGSVKLSSPD